MNYQNHEYLEVEERETSKIKLCETNIVIKEGSIGRVKK